MFKKQNQTQSLISQQLQPSRLTQKQIQFCKLKLFASWYFRSYPHSLSTMSLDFYQPPSHKATSFQFRNSQHATNQRYFRHNRPKKKLQYLPQQQSIQQFNKTIHHSNTPQLHQQTKFFPSIRPRVKDPYKIQQIYIINQKEKRKSSMLQTKIKLYKSILQTEENIKKSKEKYLSDRYRRYDSIKNSSFIELNQKLHHANRFNINSKTSLDQLPLSFRSNSLYFRTVEQLDRTIHKVNKKGLTDELQYCGIAEPQTQRSTYPIKTYIKQRDSNFDEYNNRYLDQEKKSYPDATQGFMIGSMEDVYKKKRFQDLSKQRQKINEMVKMYREYQENEALYKKINAKT